ncbi:MAG: hypothetical protein Ct9H300mP11_06600 [Chloroflexota bacterium]|nr:MAG: hypothetical protein Ct9H300mP11_06600 [Chloroflexota bacterium]
MVVALPLGLLSAIYLSEYAPDKVRKPVKPILEVLAGIPTVVYGYFALLFVTPILRQISGDISVFNALSASIVMGIMILPMVSSLSEDAMRSVPRTLREGAYALGSTKLEGIDLGGRTGGFVRYRVGIHFGGVSRNRRDNDRYYSRRAEPKFHT